jgi:hypothetical protein
VKFNICFGNLYSPNISPPAVLTLKTIWGDMVRYVYLGLRELGHDVSINTNYVDPTAVNIFWERFHQPQMVRDLVQRGYRYALIVTEPMTTPGAYNPFEFAPHIAQAIWKDVAEAVKGAEFVWYLLEEARDGCRALNPNSHYLGFSFVEGYEQVDPPELRRPVADFLLSGEPTERRGRQVAKLKEAGVSVATVYGFEPDYVRTALLGQVRASLVIQKSEKHSIFSAARIYHAIMNRVPIFVEYDGPPHGLSDYLITSPASTFSEKCREFVRRSDLNMLAQNNYDAFRETHPARTELAKLVDLTCKRQS